MAVFSFLVSSLFGMISGLICWAYLGYSALSAFGLYLSLSMVVGMALVLAGMMAVQAAGDKVGA